MLIDSLNAQLITALKAKDEFQVSLLRMLIAAIHNREIEVHGKGEKLSEEDVLDVLKKELKKRKESAAVFGEAGRAELAEKESKEAAYIETLLPAQLPENEILKIIDDAFAEMGTVTPQDFGKVMKAVMAKTGGQADGGTVSKLIKAKLG
jgi:uncharacterized protein YqeY